MVDEQIEWAKQKWLFWIPWTVILGTSFFTLLFELMRVKTVAIVNLIAVVFIAIYIVKFGK